MADQLERLLEDQRTNALVAWALVAFLWLVAVESVLTDDLLWAGFVAGVVALAVLPAVAFRDPSVMLPWEVLVLGALPVLGRALATWWLTTEVATYLSVAALALVVAVELDAFTAVAMPAWFAVLFVVLATMATAGVWAVLQWTSDVYLQTEWVLDPELTPEEQEARLMWDFVAATAAGVVAGVVFDVYFRRMDAAERRLPEAGG